MPGHHAVGYGLTAAALGWEAEAAAAAYLYSTTALLIGAALRLLSMGQMEGQRALWELHPVAPMRCGALPPASSWPGSGMPPSR